MIFTKKRKLIFPIKDRDTGTIICILILAVLFDISVGGSGEVFEWGLLAFIIVLFLMIRVGGPKVIKKIPRVKRPRRRRR